MTYHDVTHMNVTYMLHRMRDTAHAYDICICHMNAPCPSHDVTHDVRLMNELCASYEMLCHVSYNMNQL